MSTGGIFQLITNDGKQDKLLMATDYLSARLAEIKKSRKGMEDENPTLADIEKTHVLFMNAHFKPFAAMAYEYNKVSLSNATLGSQLQFSIPQFGDFFNDMVLHMVLSAPTASLTPTGTPGPGDVAVYRWCNWPGERICQRVSFDVNGNPLDDYYSDTYNMHRQFKVGADKMAGWARNMGQEQTKQAYYQYAQAASGTAPGNSRATFGILNGHQTYKAQHPELELFVPLLFWFNTDASLSIPSVAIPYGQRYIKVDLATKEQLLRVIVNPDAPAGGTAPVVTTPAISVCELYINNIFVQPDIHDIFIKRIGFSLVRVHRRQITNVNKSSDQILLQQLKWPIETIYCGLRPTANLTSNANVTTIGSQVSSLDPAMDDWHRFGQVSTSIVAGNVTAGITSGYVLKSESNHVSTISVEAHGIQLYNNLPAQFFNSYIPYAYGGWNIVTPTDPGLFMITFNLYPGSYQPSGHINVSRAREFYFKYASTYITSTLTADLVVNASAINFLLISDGSAIMRYTT
jgi:hypothetical protein